MSRNHIIGLSATAESSCQDGRLAFEAWLERESPSGDHDSIMRQWVHSADFEDLEDSEYVSKLWEDYQ